MSDSNLKRKESDRLYREKNKEKRALYNKLYREQNPSYYKEYVKSNKEKLKSYNKNYYSNNKDKIKTRANNWYKDNTEKALNNCKNWRNNNRGVCNSLKAMYKIRKRVASCSWLSEDQLKEIKYFYELAKECEILTGDKYHVDHIIPLKGENVCGLHVPWNLQVLPADINMSKGNKL